MKKYNVLVEETLSKVITIEAESNEHADKIVQDYYDSDKVVLNHSNISKLLIGGEYTEEVDSGNTYIKSQIIEDIQTASNAIEKNFRYSCGLIPYDNGRLFFLSPDGQDYELYCLLLKMGYENRGEKCGFNWKVKKSGEPFVVEYVEGDIFIQDINK